MGGPIVRSIVYWGSNWGPLILGNYYSILFMIKILHGLGTRHTPVPYLRSFRIQNHTGLCPSVPDALVNSILAIDAPGIFY